MRRMQCLTTRGCHGHSAMQPSPARVRTNPRGQPLPMVCCLFVLTRQPHALLHVARAPRPGRRWCCRLLLPQQAQATPLQGEEITGYAGK